MPVSPAQCAPLVLSTMSLTDLAGASFIELTAVDEGRNCRRAYRIERTEDLFGHQLIELSWPLCIVGTQIHGRHRRQG